MKPWRSLNWLSLARWSTVQLDSSHAGCSRAHALLPGRSFSLALRASADSALSTRSHHLSHHQLQHLSSHACQSRSCWHTANLRTCHTASQRPQAAVHAAQAPQALPAAKPAPGKANSDRRFKQAETKPLPTPPRLNAQQQAAAHSDINKPLLIIAGVSLPAGRPSSCTCIVGIAAAHAQPSYSCCDAAAGQCKHVRLLILPCVPAPDTYMLPAC